MPATTRHLLLGGQRSGKSGHAQSLALAWCAASHGRRATVVATAQVHDDDMRARVERHRRDRPPSLATAEVPLALAEFIADQSAPDHLLLVDCLTLWLTQWLMPAVPVPVLSHRGLAPATGRPDVPDQGTQWMAQRDAFERAVACSAGPLLLVSNEISMGVTPLGAQARHCVDELGRLHQALGRCCDHVTLMVAGLPLAVKPQGA
jgi:adenosylcobinamide kinase/adenosylcobinamide-phosphate guanylyltransferase